MGDLWNISGFGIIYKVSSCQTADSTVCTSKEPELKGLKTNYCIIYLSYYPGEKENFFLCKNLEMNHRLFWGGFGFLQPKIKKRSVKKKKNNNIQKSKAQEIRWTNDKQKIIYYQYQSKYVFITPLLSRKK